MICASSGKFLVKAHQGRKNNTLLGNTNVHTNSGPEGMKGVNRPVSQHTKGCYYRLHFDYRIDID